MAKKSKNPLEDKLKNFEENWKDAQDNPVGVFSAWEDGDYSVALVEAELCESKKGRLQVKFGFQDLESEEEDVHYMFDGLDPEVSEECFAWLQRHIEQMGFEYPGKISQLPKTLEGMVEAEPHLRITLETKAGKGGQEFQNTYIQNVIEE